MHRSYTVPHLEHLESEAIFVLREVAAKFQNPVLLFSGGKMNPGEHFRIFPLSNWTEMDIWQYIKRENIEIPSIYFSHKRPVLERGGTLMAVTAFITIQDGEEVKEECVRFRTVGDATCTGCIRSSARTVDDIIAEVAAARRTERGTRADDRRSETSMEDRKKQGYF